VKKQLTATAVERIKAPATGQTEIFDTQFPGLALRINYGGRRSWAFYYRHGGKIRRLPLGVYPDKSLADAREAWRAARAVVQAGNDPAAGIEKPVEASPLFEDVLADWLKRDQAENRTRDDVARMINKDATAAWQGRRLDSIGRRDVLDVLDAVADRGSKITANRLYAHLHRLFRWSVGRGIIDANPMADAPKPGSETKRDRVLSDLELLKIWQAAATMGYPYGSIIQLLILTGARRAEIAGLQWAEVDDDEINLAGGRTKNGMPFTIPLSKPARAIIDGLPDGDGLVFATNGTPVSGWSKLKRRLDGLAKLEAPWTVHDFRRSVSTGMNERGAEPHIVEAVLGHTVKGVAAVYNKAKHEAAKRAALEAWGAHISALVHGKARGKVVPMRRWRAK
jgi:integrase